MYAQYRCIKAAQCLVLPPGTTPAEGASCFVNPLTALGMVETMRAEGHKALVHTAAASNLGQMLVKICVKDKVELVNIVRKPEQADVLEEGRGHPRVRLERAHLHGRSHRGAGRDRRDARLRRHRRRPARRPDPHLPWRSRRTGRRRSTAATAPPCTSRCTSTAGWTGIPRVHPRLRHGVGHRRLAAHAVPPEDRPRGRPEAAAAGGGRDQDHVRQHATRRKSPSPRRSTSRRSPSTARWATGEKYLINPSKGPNKA